VRRIKFIARKEFYHILRDPRSLMIVIAMPIMMTLLYGFAINLDVENVVIAIIDQDRTFESRQLISDFYNSTYFTRPSEAVGLKDPEAILRASEASAILVIRPDFAEAVEDQREFEVGLLVDGSDVTVAAAVQSYAKLVLRKYLVSRSPEGTPASGVMISPRILYNPDLKSAHFFVPGLVAIILMMISALLTSITIAREKETGTLEQLLTAPVKPTEIVLGKLLPYILIAFLDGALVLAFAKFVFGVPFVGSHLLLLVFGFIYVSTSLAIGILISSLVKTQQVAMMIALSATMLPSVMLSGFVFATKNMPLFLRIISHMVPARYFVTIIRGIMLKGAGATVLLPQALALLALMLVFMGIAARKFNTRVA
jgi:ABC-2 type transport system permease protein